MALNPLINERELLAKIAHGDEMAFKAIYDHYHQRVYGFAYNVIRSKELAQETVQEAFLKIWQLGAELKNINNLEGYLKTIVKRRSIDHLRKKELERKAERELKPYWNEGHTETEQSIILNETKKILEDGIKLLPQQQKLVYQLCQQQGLKYEQAAEQMNITHGTVHKHMKLAQKFLRAYVQEHTDVIAVLVIFKLL